MGVAAVVLFAKAPLPGRVKTRLSPEIGPAAAAELQAALVADTAAVVREACGLGPGARLFCAVAEPAEETLLAPIVPPDFGRVEQGPGDLGARLERVFERLLAQHDRALALGTDCAELTPAILRSALAALARSEAVLGPAVDGGYWAIGLARPRPALFTGVPWSTSEVAAETRRRLAAAGLAWEELPTLSDLDRIEDLRAWSRAPSPWFPRTLEWCRARGLA